MGDQGLSTSQNIIGLSRPVITIVGPTASGKSMLAQQLALQLDGEVVSADSMQIYTGMDIGTGKLAPEDQVVPHHGFDLIDPGMPYSAALFQEYARQAFIAIDSNNKQPFLCGGTGFYVRAALDGYDFPSGEQVGNDVRDHYNRFVIENGEQALWDLLNEKDPESAGFIAPHDSKRVVRAFEMLEDGTSYAEQKAKLASIPQVVPALFIGLAVEPTVLNERIDDRVDAMIAHGWLAEVQSLLDKGLRTGLTAPQAIGYKELVAVLDGDMSLDEAVDMIKTATHRYGKRQRTWFRKDHRIHWIDANEPDITKMVADSLAIIECEHAELLARKAIP